MEAQNVIATNERRKPKVGKHVRKQVTHERHSERLGRARSGAATGTTPHFKMWMADLNLKRALESTKLSQVAKKHTVPALALSYTLLHEGGIKNVYRLTQADARDLLRISGIGPKRLEAVKADLASRHVSVRW
jgi:DNA uptake protein ComE-like DNA-binding protein